MNQDKVKKIRERIKKVPIVSGQSDKKNKSS